MNHRRQHATLKSTPTHLSARIRGMLVQDPHEDLVTTIVASNSSVSSSLFERRQPHDPSLSSCRERSKARLGLFEMRAASQHRSIA